MMKNWRFISLSLLLVIGCNQKDTNVPVVGFVDAFEDNTIGQAKTGFIDALEQAGYEEKKGTLKIIYRNAQGNIPTLTQIINYFIAQEVTLIATNPSLSTITAVQNTKTIPIFMMVSPSPELMKVNDAQGHAPDNLLGVGETLDYIDTSFLLIPKVVKSKSGPLTVGMLYNQSEPQSVEAMERIRNLATNNNITLIYQSVNSSADVPLVTASLLARNIDVFFANPDNIVFASFESILQSCNQKNIPIFTSEAGLVQRGALAAYGADIYQWGYQAGTQAAQYLKSKNLQGLHWEMVTLRKKVYNPVAAQKFGINIPTDFGSIQ
ncbi:MAG: ABC transporter substrate-binding protein [Saprospiraceae bacterium]|nr:ABC transporter substrate-binding protein [Saprospiraceae bacterium]MBP8094642.1 ABC transporter substrate-binding protein [Saprospiraceae bacterium]